MAPRTCGQADKNATKALLEYALRRAGNRSPVCFRVEFSDGTAVQTQQSKPVFSVRFKTRGAQWRSAVFGHIGMLDSYFDQSVDIDGDLRHALAVGMQTGYDTVTHPLVRLRNQWHELLHSNASRSRAKDNARFHYGLGADFYRLWLDDPLMMYTCAYWREGTRDLEEAQRNKIEHVCRKLRLQPGESVVDIGCGFGGFMLHAMERFGVRVTGVNTTTEQVEWLRAQVRQRGLADRLQVVEADFREVHAQFDKVVSIGTLEHAGRDQLADVVRAHADFLKPGGLGIMHFIGHVGRSDTELFIRENVFPGGWIPSLAEVIDAMADCDLEVVDIENLRRHYGLTLDAWAERFDRSWDRIRSLDPGRFDERFRRIWRTYLYACAEVFRLPAGHTHLFQIVYSKGNITDSSYPMSRAFLYEPGGSARVPS